MPKGAGLTKPMKLSTELADIVGKKEASRAECIKQLWAYIKKNNLQDPENKQFFVPDKKMAKVNNDYAWKIISRILKNSYSLNFLDILLMIFLFLDLRKRQDPCLRYGQVPLRSLVLKRASYSFMTMIG